MKELDDLISSESARQQKEICLIASENICSKRIRAYMGSCLTNKYAEGYPGHRYYGGCEIVDKIEQLAINLACEVFGSKYANVQPHSGSQANQAVYLALCNPNQTILGMDLNAGGHLTHGSKVSSSGKFYNAIHYGLDSNGYINYEEIKEKLYAHHPRLLVVGASAYPRKIDFKHIREIVDEYNGDLLDKINSTGIENIVLGVQNNPLPSIKPLSDEKMIEYLNNKCLLMVDMAHIAGLVAAHLHKSPIPYADVVTSTTHKTLRGPRGGLILWNNSELTDKINKAVFPGVQGGPLEHIIAAKAQCFYEALRPEFTSYIQKVINNCYHLSEVLKENGIKLVTNGTDNHLLLVDLSNLNISGKLAETYLGEIGIVVNKNMIFNDTRKPNETSGIRIGTACITTRDIPSEMIDVLGGLIARVLKKLGENKELTASEIHSYRNTVNWIVGNLKPLARI